jgi:hypothetical protein
MTGIYYCLRETGMLQQITWIIIPTLFYYKSTWLTLFFLFFYRNTWNLHLGYRPIFRLRRFSTNSPLTLLVQKVSDLLNIYFILISTSYIRIIMCLFSKYFSRFFLRIERRHRTVRIISLRFEKRLNAFEHAFSTPTNFPGTTF